MAKFYVGQRVRIKYSVSWPELAGKEGVISGEAFNKGPTGTSEWLVAPDCWGTHIAPVIGKLGGIVFGPNSDQLEPLIKPDNQVGSWDEMGFHPSDFLREHYNA